MPPTRGVLFVADSVLVFFVLTPLHVIFWRGTWDIWDHYVQVDCKVIPNATGTTSPGEPTNCKEFTGNWISAGVGCFCCWILNCVSPLAERGGQRLSKAGYAATSRLFKYVFAFSCFGQWRGVWNLLDEYTDTSWRSNLPALGASLALTLLLRTVRHAIPQPWTNTCDQDGLGFRGGGWLQMSPEVDGWWRFCADVALSQALILTNNILLWRCWWNIMDDVILPGTGDIYDLSSGICTAVGAVASFILVFISFKASRYSTKLDKGHPLAKIAFEDFFNLFVLAATTMYWRGFWNLIEEHLLPASRHGKEKGAWVCHAVGLVGLMAGLSFGSCYDNSVSLDGDLQNGEGVRPSYNLLRYMCLDRHVPVTDNQVASMEMVVTQDKGGCEKTIPGEAPATINHIGDNQAMSGHQGLEVKHVGEATRRNATSFSKYY